MADVRIKHTPGPWKVEYDGAGYPMIAGGEATDWGTEARYHWVAKVLPVPTGLYRGGKYRDTGKVMETEANARLIAAAPRLLEALEFAAAGFAVIANDKTAAQHSRDFARDNFDQANAAIAEAEGRK